MNPSTPHDAKTPPHSQQYTVSSFFNGAETLRAEFEQKIRGALDSNGGVTPLLYAFSSGGHQCLTAGAEKVFTGETLEDLIETLRVWGRSKLNASHVSTPQIRVYIGKWERDFLCDDVDVQWHYILSLTPDSLKGGTIKLLPRSFPADDRIQASEVMRMQLVFNALLVHSSANAYGIEPAKTAKNPLEGTVFLDGYMW